MDIILVDTSGITASGGDLAPEMLEGIGAAVAASVASVTEELEKEGLIPSESPEASSENAAPESVAEIAEETSERADDGEGAEQDSSDPELAGFEASLADSVAASIASLNLDEDPEEGTGNHGDTDAPDEDHAPPLYSPNGKDHLFRVFDWLIQQGQPFRLIGCLPEVGPGMRDWFSELLFEVRMKYEPATLMVVNVTDSTPETLERLYGLGFRSIILYDDGSLDAFEIEDRIKDWERFHKNIYIDAEGGARTPRQSELVCWGLWMDWSNNVGNYGRLRRYQDSIIPWDEITGAQFQMGREQDPIAPKPEAPGGYLPESLPCRLYNNSITIDTTGEVLYCARYCHQDGAGVAANIFRHAPEEMLVQKGASSLSVGCASRCLDCGVGGRFFWPEDAVNVVAEFMALGKTEQGVAAYTPTDSYEGRSGDFDLAAADTETQERELAQFEESLSDWAASMEDWDDEKPAN